jgi:hypothetical protein
MKSDLKWALKQDKKTLFKLFNNGTEDEKRTLIEYAERLQKNEKREQQEQENKNNQRRWSLIEFKTHIKKKLSNDLIKQILKESRCIKLYRLLFGDTTKIIVHEEDDDKDDVNDKECDERSLDYHTCKEAYLETFIAILRKINIPDKNKNNADRLKFHTFLDTCWESLNFDIISLGNIDLVFDEETCKNPKDYSIVHLVKPYQLRLYCLDHIKTFFFEKMEVEEIDEVRTNFITAQFVGI